MATTSFPYISACRTRGGESERGRHLLQRRDPMSYGELNRRANRLARRLQAAGAARDQLIAIGMERSIDMVVGLLAILKSGAAYLPIDLEYPPERSNSRSQDAAAGRAADPFGEPSPRCRRPACRCCWPTTPAWPHEDDSDIGNADPDATAYCIYTSGSTGRPKGCLVTHANVARLFDATDDWFGFGPDDVWTFFHSHAFDFSVWEIWGALLHGGRVVVVPYAVTRSPADFLELLVREQVTVLNQTPSAFRSLIDADRRAGAGARGAGAALRDLRRRGACPSNRCAPGSSATATRRRGWSTCTASPRPRST